MRIKNIPASNSEAIRILALGLALGCALACAGGTASEDDSGPLRIAVPGEPSSLDPHLGFDEPAVSLLGNLYEPLVALDGNMRVVPALAERWENPDERTVRFRLRGGVAFHDGRPLTVRDVASSLARARRLPRSRLAGMLVAVEDVKVLDERTIELRTASPYPILLSKLASVAVVPDGAPEPIGQPIGTGPYRLAGYEPGERAILEPHAGHWRGAPPAARVEYRFVAEAGERLALLTAGEVDLIDDLAPRDVARLEETPGFRVLSRSGLAVDYLEIDPASAPFDDLRLRRAIDLAVDRRALVDGVLAGRGRPAAQVVGANVYGHAPDLEPAAPDRETARRLLAEAGHPGGLEIALGQDDGLGAALRGQLQTVGIRPTTEKAGPAPPPTLHLGRWTCAAGDASDFLDNKVHSYDPDRGYGAAGSVRFSDPEIDRLIERAATLGTEARREVLEEALRRLAEEHVFLPLFAPFDLYGAREELEWTPRQDGRLYAFEMRVRPARSALR